MSLPPELLALMTKLPLKLSRNQPPGDCEPKQLTLTQRTGKGYILGLWVTWVVINGVPPESRLLMQSSPSSPMTDELAGHNGCWECKTAELKLFLDDTESARSARHL
jgi:hypothetical protein